MGVSPPVSERRWRTLAAGVASPATLVLLYLASSAGSLAIPGHADKFFPGMFMWGVMMSYVASALIGAMTSALRFWLKAPLRAGVVVSLYALSAAPWGLMMDGNWTVRLVFLTVFAVLSLPVSITYCAIAGVRWR